MVTTDLLYFHSFAFSPGHHIVEIIQDVAFTDWLLSLSNKHWRSSVSFHGLIVYLFLVLSDIQFSIRTQLIYPFIYWRTSWLPPSFGNYEQNNYKHLCVGFWVDLSFQLIWVNTKECNCWSYIFLNFYYFPFFVFILIMQKKL